MESKKQSPEVPTVMIPSHYCTRCMRYHPMHYLIGEGCHHLIVECPKAHYFIRYQPDLNIQTKESKRLIKSRLAAQQPELL